MKKHILFTILLLPFLQPAGLGHIFPWLEAILDIWKVVSTFIVLTIYFSQSQVSPIVITIILYEGVRAASTFINGGDYLGLLIECVTVVSLSMLIEIALKWDAFSFLKTAICLLTIICVLNLITVVAFPDGLYSTTFEENWLLGYDNSHIIMILPLAICYMLYAYGRKYNPIHKLLFLALIFASIYITWSATSVVGVSLFALLWVLSEANIHPSWINLKLCVIFAGVLFGMIVILREQEWLTYLIVNFLGKNLTLTGRTYIWDKGLKAFLRNPILGNGVLETTDIRRLLGGASHCHNMFLHILFESGVLGMLGFMAVIFVMFKPLKQVQDTPYGYLINVTFLCYFVIFQAEVYNLMYFFAICTIAYHLPMVVPQIDHRECVKRRVKFKLGNRLSVGKEGA